MEYSRCFNFTVLGEVGKSHFRREFCKNHYNMESKVKLGIEYGTRDEFIQGERVKINMWEPASLDSFRSLTKTYYHGATASFLLFDVTNKATFENLTSWVEVARWSFPSHMYFVLVATTTEVWKEREVSSSEASKFAQSNGLSFLDIGSAEKSDVEKLVISTADAVLSDIKSGKIDENDMINGVILIRPPTTGLARCF